VKEHVRKYKENNPQGIVYFEDAHYHNKDIRRHCQEELYRECDIVCLNEEELVDTLQALDFEIHEADILSCVEGAVFIRKHFGVKKGVVVHTANYAMYVGEQLHVDIEKGLICGNLLATGKTVTGWYADLPQIGDLLEKDLSKRGLEDLQKVADSQYADCVTLVPTKYIDKPKYTIGLGDSFVAGVQTCF
jgi:ADP-dependent phosphofructokinase/glucokinase